MLKSRTHRSAVPLCGSVMILVITLLALPSACGAGTAGFMSLNAAAAEIVRDLEHKDYVGFGKYISADRLLVVRREPDWDESNVPSKDPPANVQAEEPHFCRSME